MEPGRCWDTSRVRDDRAIASPRSSTIGFVTSGPPTGGRLKKPMLEPQSRTDRVTQVMRTDLGELKWMERRATEYTTLEQVGRAVYTREGCWYCHSQYVRPVTGETRRWGAIEMRNLIGDDVEAWRGILSEPGASLHLYGKAAARPGRKMGHVTMVRP